MLSSRASRTVGARQDVVDTVIVEPDRYVRCFAFGLKTSEIGYSEEIK